MTRITIVPAGPRDQAMHGEQFAALARALDALGHEPEIDIGVEKRSIAGVVIVYVALRLAERVTDDALDAIIERVKGDTPESTQTPNRRETTCGDLWSRGRSRGRSRIGG
jgi:hypothetical protein